MSQFASNRLYRCLYQFVTGQNQDVIKLSQDVTSVADQFYGNLFQLIRDRLV